MRAWFCLATLVLIAPALAADAPERDRITIDLKRQWISTAFSPNNVPVASDFQMSLTGEYAKFSVNQAGARASFAYTFDLPFEMTTYPNLVLKYRAKNLDTQNNFTCIWIMEGQRTATFPLIDFEKLTVDGEIHEIEIDITKAPTGAQGAPFESGPVKGLMVSVMNVEGSTGTLELIDAQFRSATEAPKTLQPDQPINVRVIDHNKDPIRNATITVDAERKETAKSFTTNEEGLATVVPLKHELDLHVILVEADGQVPMTIRLDQAPSETLEVALPQAMTVGGTIEDEQSKPIRNATVRVYAVPGAANRDRKMHVRYTLTVRTNSDGQWLSSELPYTDQIYLQITHPDYKSDQGLTMRKEIVDELRSGIATIQLKK